MRGRHLSRSGGVRALVSGMAKLMASLLRRDGRRGRRGWRAEAMRPGRVAAGRMGLQQISDCVRRGPETRPHARDWVTYRAGVLALFSFDSLHAHRMSQRACGSVGRHHAGRRTGVGRVHGTQGAVEGSGGMALCVFGLQVTSKVVTTTAAAARHARPAYFIAQDATMNETVVAAWRVLISRE